MSKWCVYLIKNSFNGKGYVGITNERYKTINDRLVDHIELAHKGGKYGRNGRMYALHAAILKYGSENFTIDYLTDYYSSLSKAQEDEIKWIAELNTYASGRIRNGYNLSLGGEKPDWDPDDDLAERPIHKKRIKVYLKQMKINSLPNNSESKENSHKKIFLIVVLLIVIVFFFNL
jgi:hypothetical protein